MSDMRRFLIGGVFLAMLSSCTGFSQAVCASQEKVTKAVSDAGAYLGPPGALLASLVNLGLDVMCGTVDAAAGFCSDCGAVVGLGSGAGGHADAVAESRPAGGN
jgi:hypothetical protein